MVKDLTNKKFNHWNVPLSGPKAVVVSGAGIYGLGLESIKDVRVLRVLLNHREPVQTRLICGRCIRDGAGDAFLLFGARTAPPATPRAVLGPLREPDVELDALAGLDVRERAFVFSVFC